MSHPTTEALGEEHYERHPKREPHPIPPVKLPTEKGKPVVNSKKIEKGGVGGF